MATKLASSISRSKSSSSVESLPDRRQTQKSLACCCLVRATSTPGSDTRRQCVIFDLGEKASKALQSSCNPPLALLTENHVSNIEEWKLHIGCLGESLKRSVKLQLKKKNFSRCDSCCVACETQLAPSSCTVNGHWSLFVLAQEFVTTMLSKLRHLSVFFPVLPDLELEDLLKSNRRFCMHQQKPEENVAVTPIAIQPVNTTPETVKSLESDVKAYKKTSLLMFQPTPPDLTAVMDASYFGSPIYYIDDHSPDGAQFCLLGMVCSISQPKGSPSISANADSVHLFASTIFHIIHSAISDGTHLDLIPCLAYLSDTFECSQMNTCQNEAITKLVSCLERCKEKLDLTQSIELLIFLLKKMPPLVDLTRKPSITSRKALKIQQHAKLLTRTFSCFRGVDPAEISQASYSGGASILHKLVGDLCKQILRLMECSTEQETEDVIQAGFELWKEVLHFTYPEGPALQLTSDEALETARELWERDKYKQNAAIQRSYAIILQEFCRQEKSIKDERQQLLQEKEAQLLAENHSKQQAIDHLESSVQDQKIENEQLKAEQKQWQQEKVTLVQDRDRLLQEEQSWLQEREELKEEGKQQQQKFRDLEQQLQEKIKQQEDLEREKEAIRDEQQQLLEKIHEKEAQLLAVKGENDSKQQAIDHLESSVQYRKTENEQLKAEQKQWQQERVTLVQDRDRLLQEEQRWLQEREELKEEGKQQQQKFHDLEQQLQEQKEDLERENNKLYSDLAVHKQEIGQLKTKNRMLLEDSNKNDKDLDCLKQQLERREQVLKLQQASVLSWQPKRNSPALRRHKTVPFGSPPSSPFMARRACTPTLASNEGDKDFWERDMSKLLEEDLGLREAVCQLFRKVEGGSGEGTWEHLLRYLQERFDVKMDAAKLDTLPIGDIMQSIVQEWAKKEAVTVRLFSNISKELGVLRVEEIMKEAFVKLKSQPNISY